MHLTRSRLTLQTLSSTWPSSQQSGLLAEPALAKGAAGGLQIIPPQLRWVRSYFSEEGGGFPIAAAAEGRLSQTHHSNPDADMCYSCRICAKVLNPTGLSKHTTRHFLRTHNAPNRGCRVALREEPWKQIRIRTGGSMARRSGVDPPPLSAIQDHVEQADSQPETAQRNKKKPHGT